MFVFDVRVLDSTSCLFGCEDASQIEAARVSNFGNRVGVGGCADSIRSREHLAGQPAKVPLASDAVPRARRG